MTLVSTFNSQLYIKLCHITSICHKQKIIFQYISTVQHIFCIVDLVDMNDQKGKICSNKKNLNFRIRKKHDKFQNEFDKTNQLIKLKQKLNNNKKKLVIIKL